MFPGATPEICDSMKFSARLSMNWWEASIAGTVESVNASGVKRA